MRSRDLVVLPHMVDVAHLRRVGVHPVLDVLDYRVVVPGPFPQLVEHLEVIVGDFVAVVVVDLVAQPEVARRVGQVRGHHVPRDPALGEMVQSGHAAGEGERWFVGRG
jgi:hypothetical protein